MNRGDELKGIIVQTFEELMSEHQEVTKEMLESDGQIYYMNGNDGTDFDWEANDRLCEFYTFYKETAMGCIKLIIDKEDRISGYFYPDLGRGKAEPFSKGKLEEGDAEYLEGLLMANADELDLYDEPIGNLDFSNY